MKKAIVVVRWLLTVVLVYGIYCETGCWTALFALLMTIAVEMQFVHLSLLGKLRKLGRNDR